MKGSGRPIIALYTSYRNRKASGCWQPDACHRPEKIIDQQRQECIRRSSRENDCDCARPYLQVMVADLTQLTVTRSSHAALPLHTSQHKYSMHICISACHTRMNIIDLHTSAVDSRGVLSIESVPGCVCTRGTCAIRVSELRLPHWGTRSRRSWPLYVENLRKQQT